MVENLLPVLCFIDLQLVRAVLAAVRRAVTQSPPRTLVGLFLEEHSKEKGEAS